MICPKCGGTGKEDIVTGLNCSRCWGRGEAEVTNEEWLRSASTLDELAERVFNCAMANSWAMNEQQFKTAILSWLKEKHTDG